MSNGSIYHAFCSIVDNNHLQKPQNSTIVLRELSNNVQYWISVTNVPKDAFAFKVDAFFLDNQKIQFFNGGTKGLGCRCDYVIVDPVNRKLNFIELKRSNYDSTSHIVNQLKGGVAIVSFVHSLINEFVSNDIDFSYYSRHFTAVTTKGSGSKVTGNVQPNNAPLLFRRIVRRDRSSLPYKLLIA